MSTSKNDDDDGMWRSIEAYMAIQGCGTGCGTLIGYAIVGYIIWSIFF